MRRQRGFWPALLVVALLLPALLPLDIAPQAQAAQGTEIIYDDRDPNQDAYQSRLLILGERLRMDYGRDNEDFILYDRKARTVYLVSHDARRVTEIAAGPVKLKTPKGWRVKLDKQSSAGQHLTQARLNDRLCAEFKNANLLPDESRLMADFRRALAANQAKTWAATPAEMRDACLWLMDIQEAGVEYRHGLLLALRHADGRSRVYRRHSSRELPAELFKVPKDYSRFRVGGR